MTIIETILVDLDGVLVNFHSPAFLYWGCSPNIFDYPSQYGWDIVDALNHQRKARGLEKVTPYQFWRGLDKEFWATLPMYPYARTFMAGLERMVGQENITICTSAAFDSECAGGKVEWINRELPAYRRQYFIGCQKFRLANPNVLLIDDSEKNVDSFREYGGSTLLFPRPWNSHKSYESQEAYDYILQHVKYMV